AEGDILVNAQDPLAERPLIEAVRLAGAARDDRVAARALTLLVVGLAEAQQSAARAVLVADIADGAVARLGDGTLRAQLLRNRAQALLTQGRLVEAWVALTLARAYFTAAGGEGDSDTIGTVFQLARVAEAHGDYALARKLGDENLARTIAVFGPGHPLVADNLTNQALYLLQGGDLERAADHYRRALAIQQASLPPESAGIALTWNNIGAVAMERGRLEEAEDALQRALAARERLFGPEHAFVAQTLDNLAMVERKRGQFDRALEIAERALAIRTKALGPRDPSVAQALWTVGSIFEIKGDLVTALDYYRRAWEVRRQAQGPDHPATLGSRIAVAWGLAQLRRCDEARPILGPLLPALEKAFGAEHPWVAVAVMAVATCDLVDGRGAPALAGAERALALLEKAKAGATD